MHRPALSLALLAVPLVALARPHRLAGQDIIGARDSVTARVDAVFRAFDRTDGPGCALGVYQGGRILYARGYGMANLELGVPIGPRTVFDVGSVSKQFTALTMLLLEQDGLLRLDDPIRRRFPELPAYADSITWRHVLSHSSGLRDYLTLMSIAGWNFDGYADTTDFLRVITRSSATNFPIGTRYLYSNTGWVLMAAATRRLTGRTIARFARERIFEPLGMQDTRWHDDHGAIYPNRAQGYAPRAGGFRIAMSQFDGNAGPGGVHTTVVDLARWFQNFDSAWVGSRAALDAMQTPGRFADGTPVAAGATSTYGLGLSLGSWRGVRTVEHGGAWAGYRAHLLRFPDQHLAVACLCNTTNAGPDSLARQVGAVYLAPQMTADTAAAWQRALEAERSASVDPAALQRLDGVYRNDSLGELRRVRVVRGDTVLWGFGAPARATVLGPSRLRLRPPGGQMTELSFEGDSAGVAATLRTRTGGGGTRWRRVAAVTPTAAQLAEYAGDYESPDLETTWTIAADTAGLTATRRGQDRLSLAAATRDVFVVRASGSLIEFERDARGRLTGFQVQAGRARNVRFIRATRPGPPRAGPD